MKKFIRESFKSFEKIRKILEFFKTAKESIRESFKRIKKIFKSFKTTKESTKILFFSFFFLISLKVLKVLIFFKIFENLLFIFEFLENIFLFFVILKNIYYKIISFINSKVFLFNFSIILFFKISKI